MALSMMKSVAMPVQMRKASQPRAVRSAVVARRSVVTRAADSGNTGFDSNWLRKDPLVLVLGFVGWTVPASIGVQSFGGESLFSLFLSSIGENLAHFPQGPAQGDKFWLYFVIYHVGLFSTLLLGQIGVQGRKQIDYVYSRLAYLKEAMINQICEGLLVISQDFLALLNQEESCNFLGDCARFNAATQKRVKAHEACC